MIWARRLVGGIFGALVVCTSVAEAFALPSARDYYPESLQESGLSGQALRARLHSILDDSHVSEPGKRDKIMEACPLELKPSQTCYKRQTLSYDVARRYLFGDERLHLTTDKHGDYVVRDVYCRKEFGGKDVGPGHIPDANSINTEHTWPQSKFLISPKGFMKTDLHHLFPTDSQANSIRGNHPFGEVEGAGALPGKPDCDASRIGGRRSVPQLQGAGGGGVYFEPPAEHKGNVARAMFYFAVRYNMDIDRVQEHFLRQWHESDPVDDAERDRNEAIYSLQSLRNPFIDYPELVGRISDF